MKARGVEQLVLTSTESIFSLTGRPPSPWSGRSSWSSTSFGTSAACSCRCWSSSACARAGGRVPRRPSRTRSFRLRRARDGRTLEPGIYVHGVGGYRHSDAVLVTADGYRILTNVPHGGARPPTPAPRTALLAPAVSSCASLHQPAAEKEGPHCAYTWPVAVTEVADWLPRHRGFAEPPARHLPLGCLRAQRRLDGSG
jgi:hypothetical protein